MNRAAELDDRLQLLLPPPRSTDAILTVALVLASFLAGYLARMAEVAP